MSTDYYIIRGIPKKDILDKTDIKIINHPDGGDKEFLEDKYGNILHINPQMVDECEECEPILDINNIRELTRYGGNNATYIIDTLVKEFKMVYYGDDGFQNLMRPSEESHNPDVDSNIREDMKHTHGYEVIDKDTIILPVRTEDEYKKNIN
jgi:hypothetical protein